MRCFDAQDSLRDPYASTPDPRHDQCEIILCLLLVEKGVNSPEDFISNFGWRSVQVLPDSREDAVLVKLLAGSVLRFDNSIRIENEQIAGAERRLALAVIGLLQ
jgi:hypothetical protein